MSQHDVTGVFGRSKRLERRAYHLHRGPILKNGPPGGQKARLALKTRTAAALITDHEGKAVASRIPYLDVFDRSNDATELHGMPSERPPRPPLAALYDSYVKWAASVGFAKSLENSYLIPMFKAFEFCIPVIGTKVPTGTEWLHEIKFDGYRLRVERATV